MCKTFVLRPCNCMRCHFLCSGCVLCALAVGTDPAVLLPLLPYCRVAGCRVLSVAGRLSASRYATALCVVGCCPTLPAASLLLCSTLQRKCAQQRSRCRATFPSAAGHRKRSLAPPVLPASARRPTPPNCPSSLSEKA